MFLEHDNIQFNQPSRGHKRPFWINTPEPEQRFIFRIEDNEEYEIDFETMTVVTNDYINDIYRSDQFTMKQMTQVLTYIFERLFQNENYMGI